MASAPKPHGRINFKMIALTALIALAATTFIIAEYTSSSQVWRLALNAQLQKDKRCRMDDLLASKSTALDGGVRVEGRVRCTDNREFKFVRNGSHEKFKLKSCSGSQC